MEERVDDDDGERKLFEKGEIQSSLYQLSSPLSLNSLARITTVDITYWCNLNMKSVS
jgi:hypothetical protein